MIFSGRDSNEYGIVWLFKFKKYSAISSGYFVWYNARCLFLVVNAHDEIDYIIRTMRSTEELIESKCIGIIVYPMMQKRTIGTLYKKIHISDSNYKAFKEELSKRVNIPIMSFNTVMNTEILVELITDYFSEPRDIFE